MPAPSATLAPVGYRLPDGFEFAPVAHRYSLAGAPLAGVTSVIQDAGLVDYSHIPAWYRDRGSVVHKAAELDDLGVLDEDTVAPEIAGFLAAWRRFRTEMEMVWEGIEVPVVNLRHGYAGTLDRIGVFGAGRFKGRRALLDAKSGLPSWVVGLQLAAYDMAFGECLTEGSPKPTLRAAVQVSEDGMYRLHFCSDPDSVFDGSRFLAAMSVAQMRRDHGLAADEK